VFSGAAAGVARLVRWDRQFDPDPRRSAVYAELGAEYELAYQRVAQTFGASRPARGIEITSSQGAQP
jgi:hypothetical protein